MITKREYFELLLKSADDGTFPGFENGSCKNRCSNGQKCAVGILIPDNYDLTGFLDKPLSRMPESLVEQIIPDGMSIGELIEVQNCHDRYAQQLTWNTELFKNAVKNLYCFQEFREEFKA